MRMWLVDPKNLCRNHLLGEHFEIHKFRHMFVKQQDVSTRMSRNQIYPDQMKERHDMLAVELVRRGYSHSSPYVMPDVSYCYEKVEER